MAGKPGLRRNAAGREVGPDFGRRGNAERLDCLIGNGAKLAEGVGFEPTNRLGLTVFKTAAIVHSAIPPGPLAVPPGWSTLRRRAAIFPGPACGLHTIIAGTRAFGIILAGRP